MTLHQQQRYLEHSRANVGLEELAGWTLRVQYTLPGEFQWVLPGWRKYLPSRVQERTQIAALQVARRLDPDVTEAQIVPTQLDLAICYAPAGENPARARIARRGSSGTVP